MFYINLIEKEVTRLSRLDELIQELCPDGVTNQKLRDVTLKITDGMHNLPKTVDEGDYPILSAQNISNRSINFETKKYVDSDTYLKENKRTDVSHGDILLTIVGAIGRVAVVDFELKALFQRSICVIKPNPEIIDYKYMAYVLESSKVQAYIQTNAHGAAQKGLYLKQVGEIMLAVPPLEVQREIVRILDSFTLLTAELTAELTARKSQYEFYRNELLKVDDSIKTVALEEIADIGTGSSNTNEGLEEGLYPFYVRSQEPLRKNEYEYDETAIITAGDGVGVGKVYHYVEGKYALHQRAYRIHINTPDVLPKYYFHYMKSAFFPYIQKTMFQGSVASIRRPMLNKFPVPVPSLEVQKKIIDVLENFESICNDLNIGLPAEIEARQKQYEYYRDALLTYAATGKIIAQTDRQTDRQTHYLCKNCHQTQDVTELWECQSHSSINTTQTSSLSSDLTDMSQTIQNMDIDLQSMDEKHMQEFSLRENCSGVMGVPITFLDKYNPNNLKYWD